MKIFALETDEKKLEKSFLSEGEQVLLRVTFSAFLFIIRSVRALLLTIVLISLGIGAWEIGIPGEWAAIVPAFIWFFFVFLKWVTAFIDWRYDVLLVTTEEVVYIDQSSLFHIKVRQINLDNIASVSAESQFWNLFPFGKLHFELKEGVGKTLILPYIPSAQAVSSAISDAVVGFQRRRAQLAHQHPAAPAGHAPQPPQP